MTAKKHNGEALERKPREAFHEREFWLWLQTAKPGDECVYHVGLLARDRLFSPAGRETSQSAIGKVAKLALELWQGGQVHLVQRRIGEGCFDYLCQRRDFVAKS